MDYTENNSCEDINQITSDNLIGNEGNTSNYSSGRQLYGTDDFADEYEKTREKKHDKNYKDNMRVKLKIQFYNFIISFANSIKRIVYQ